MIIKITSSITKIKEKLNDGQIAGIERLCLGIYRGENILTLENTDVVDFLEREVFEKISIISRGVLIKARSKFAFHGYLEELKAKTIFVVAKKDEAGARCEVTFADLLLLDMEPRLLAEHVNDAKIYIEAAHHYIINQKISGLSICGKTSGGGGTSIAQEFKNISQNRNLCLAVVDSDENWPSRPATPVEKKCKEVADASSGLCEAYRLPARELENMIPLNILKDIFSNKNGYYSVEQIEKILGQELEGWRCADIKQGIKVSTLRSMKKTSPEYKFYVKYFKKSGIKIEDHELENLKKNDFLLQSVGNCGDPLLKWFESRSKHAAFQLFHGHWKDYWLQLGEKVFSWCCAEGLIRS
ncbi:hypothetical protein [Acidovorax sp. Root219]|uniref:hypothetical protein n=1 Tax=Acidovorax sp. Root219 TaxID=1736493 RepID=UPI000A5C9A58|nr:hypothetical protein [Acidovorax sp. Root219]